MRLFSLLTVASAALPTVFSYIPASPTNDTLGDAASTSNLLQMEWYQDGSFRDSVSYLFAPEGSSGVTMGALVHFSESVGANQLPTTTPWIALISCDGDATDSNPNADVVTLAHEKGAVSVLFYSMYSTRCVLPSSSPSSLPLDIFATQTLASSRLVDAQLASNAQNLATYDSQALNASADAVTDATKAAVDAPGFIFGVLSGLQPEAGDVGLGGGVSGTGTSGWSLSPTKVVTVSAETPTVSSSGADSASALAGVLPADSDTLDVPTTSADAPSSAPSSNGGANVHFSPAMLLLIAFVSLWMY